MDERMWSVIADRYRLGRRLQQGQAAGGGITYIAYDLHLDQKVAVTLHPVGGLQGHGVNRFERDDERFILVNRRLARINHPGIPQVRDIGRLDDEIYIVTALVEGVSLASLLTKHGPLGPGTAAAIGAHICAALRTAHSKSVTHGSLKPASILLCRDNTVKVLGFGSAATPSRPTAGRPAKRHDEGTTTDNAYSAPEQINGAHGFPASDLYAVGCILFHMVTGRPPAVAEIAGGVRQDRHVAIAQSARTITNETPIALDQLISSLMAEAPTDRPGDAETVYNQLLGFTEPTLSTVVAETCDPYLAFRGPGSALLRSADATVPGHNYFPYDADDHDIRSHMEGLFGLMEGYPRKGEHQLVLDALRDFLGKWSFLVDHPEGLHYRLHEAEILLVLGEHQEALSRLPKLVDLLAQAEPRYPTEACEGRMLIGDCLVAAGRTEDALAIWRSTLTDWVRFDRGSNPKIAHLRQRIRAAEIAHQGTSKVS